MKSLSRLLILMQFFLQEPVSVQGQNLFLVGGRGDGAPNTVEVVDMSGSGTLCPTPADYFAAYEGSFGTYLAEEDGVIVCGGSNSTQNLRECFEYNPESNAWIAAKQMLQHKRWDAAATMVAPDRWWVTGGFDGIRYLSSTEMYTRSEGFVYSTTMPHANAGHCVIAVDESRVMLVGGLSQGGTNQTYMFDWVSDEWTELPEMPLPASGSQCGFAKHSREVVVAAGVDTAATQIFSVDTMEWRLGSDFPLGQLHDGKTVQLGDTFVVVGGYLEGEGRQTAIHEYNAEIKGWVRRREELTTARTLMAAFAVSGDFFNANGC